MDYTKLSREISFALRHHPEKYELSLDEEGWCNINQLLAALRLKKKWKNITQNDLEMMIEKIVKKRHEIKNGRIRALFGHSSVLVEKEEQEPPEILYHGTVPRFIESIKQQGLKPSGRQFVHLTSDVEIAQQVGERRDDKVIILEILAQQAFENGHKFYIGNDKVWLADFINVDYIKFTT